MTDDEFDRLTPRLLIGGIVLIAAIFGTAFWHPLVYFDIALGALLAAPLVRWYVKFFTY